MEQPGSTVGLTDYKFYCFSGVPQFLYVSRGLENHGTAEMSFYDLEFNLLPFRRRDYKLISSAIEKPSCFGEMIEISKKLSDGFPFLRVDLYEISDHVYFSELTVIPNSGLMPFEPEVWDYTLGEYLQLPSTKLL